MNAPEILAPISQSSPIQSLGRGGAIGPDAARLMAGVSVPDQLRSADLPQDEKLRIAAQQFESFLIQTLIRQMRDTVPEGGLLPKSSGEKMFREIMDDQLAEDLSGRMGLGLTEAIVRQLSPALAAQGEPSREAE